VIDSNGSVWYPTRDVNTANTNINVLIQIIATDSSTFLLRAVQKPGTMPQ
jgi:hypothetical protein